MFRKRTNLNQLSVEELEQLLRIKQRQDRQERFSRLLAKGASTNVALLAGEEAGMTKALPASPQLFAASSNHFTAPLWQMPLSQDQSGSLTRPRKNRKIRDIILLMIEIGAVIGLVLIMIGSYLNLQVLNQEVSQTQTDLAASLNRGDAGPVGLSWTVDRLPGGHTPPTIEGGGQPEIPTHLQNWIQPAPAIPLPKQTTAVATRIVIPKIKVDAPIVEGVAWEDLKKGVGHLPRSAQPGERGNMYLAAHNDIFGEIFKDLDQLEIGDKFYVYAGQAKYTYMVREKRVIDPTDVEVMLPTSEPVATLQTCYPYLIDTHRLITIADLVN